MVEQDVRAWRAGERLPVSGRPQRLVPMVVGYEPIPESLSLEGGSDHRWLLEPVTATAVVFQDGWVLLDGGFDVTAVGDPVRRAALYDAPNYTPIVPPGDPLREQVEAAGLRWSSLVAAAISHVHSDHTGGARLLEGDAPVLLQQREWAWLTGPVEEHVAVSTADVLRPGLPVRLLDGDTELADGLTAIDTRGHTPGHQSFVVELPDRRIVLACDAADLHANITRPCACGSTTGPQGAADARVAALRLHALDADPRTEVWPAHDPEWQPWRDAIDRAVAAHPVAVPAGADLGTR
jgi:N-acyl homoserine lactone hydrolase